VSEKAKLIRGDPPKIALKRRGSPLKIVHLTYIDNYAVLHSTECTKISPLKYFE
jgi:hypothetical protein